MKIGDTITCPVCEKDFTVIATNGKYCGAPCRNKRNRAVQKKREAVRAAKKQEEAKEVKTDEPTGTKWDVVMGNAYALMPLIGEGL